MISFVFATQACQVTSLFSHLTYSSNTQSNHRSPDRTSDRHWQWTWFKIVGWGSGDWGKKQQSATKSEWWHEIKEVVSRLSSVLLFIQFSSWIEYHRWRRSDGRRYDKVLFGIRWKRQHKGMFRVFTVSTEEQLGTWCVLNFYGWIIRHWKQGPLAAPFPAGGRVT